MSGKCIYCDNILKKFKNQNDADEFLAEKFRIRVEYLSGHKKYFNKEEGFLIGRTNKLIFEGKNTKFDIPLSKLIINDIKSQSTKGFEWSLTFGIFESFISKQFIKIPFKDENDIVHEPEFKIQLDEDMNKISEFLYENYKLTKNKNKQK